MHLVVAFGLVLLLAALVSGIAARSPLSTSLLVLVLGFVLGLGITGIVDVGPRDHIVTALAKAALVTVLFTDGQRMPLVHLRSTLPLAGLALVLGMPLTILGIAGLAVLLTDLTWVQGLLVGAVLAPTDPVFAAAIVQRDDISGRLLRLLDGRVASTTGWPYRSC